MPIEFDPAPFARDPASIKRFFHHWEIEVRDDPNDSKLVKWKKMPTSAEVAAYGYKAMMKGRSIAIHGCMNRIMVLSVRFSPRKMVIAIVRKMSEKAK